MIFKCKNCSGNVVYSPEKLTMFCPYCDSVESEQKECENQGVSTCLNCGGELHVNDYTSATQCPYCSSYIIFDERVSGEYTPHLIMPFKYGKESVKKMLREKFKKSIFAPSDFFSDAKLDSMEGMYVPFWLYDFDTNGRYEGEGTKVRSWTAGDRRYTETSIYRIVRELDVSFDKVPVDASDAMPDATMDLMEPYQYGALEAFKAEYMSGFFAEKYNQTAEYMMPRARDKAAQDTRTMLHNSIVGYASKRANVDTVSATCTEQNYALFPVWIYNYKYKNEDFRFHINGQTGKIVGKLPILPKKVFGYGATVFGLLFGILLMLRYLTMFI